MKDPSDDPNTIVVIEEDEPSASSLPLLDDVERLLKDYREATNHLSDLVRYIGFGLVGLFFAVLNSTSAIVQNFLAKTMLMFTLVALAGIVAIVLEYANLVCRRKAHRNLLHMIDTKDPRLNISDDKKYYQYDKSDPYYIWSNRTFLWKQVVAFAGCVLLLAIFGWYIVVTLVGGPDGLTGQLNHF